MEDVVEHGWLELNQGTRNLIQTNVSATSTISSSSSSRVSILGRIVQSLSVYNFAPERVALSSFKHPIVSTDSVKTAGRFIKAVSGAGVYKSLRAELQGITVEDRVALGCASLAHPRTRWRVFFFLSLFDGLLLFKKLLRALE